MRCSSLYGEVSNLHMEQMLCGSGVEWVYQETLTQAYLSVPEMKGWLPSWLCWLLVESN